MAKHGEPKDVFCRYEVTLGDKTASFCPKKLTDAQMADGTLKRAALGAVFLGKLSKLPNKVVKTVWEMELSLKPPAMLRPIKPKLWLVRHTELKAGKFYRLM